MKIYTKQGDQGTTSLLNGTRVPKDDLRVIAYGTVDELNAHIGLLRDLIENDDIKTDLLHIQHTLFNMQALLAVDKEKACPVNLKNIDTEDIDFLEQKIDDMQSQLSPQTYFLIPGGHPTASQCYIARCICRRAERKLISMSKQHDLDESISMYINRLSDYLFTLFRYVTFLLNVKENTWKK